MSTHVLINLGGVLNIVDNSTVFIVFSVSQLPTAAGVHGLLSVASGTNPVVTILWNNNILAAPVWYIRHRGGPVGASTTDIMAYNGTGQSIATGVVYVFAFAFTNGTSSHSKQGVVCYENALHLCITTLEIPSRVPLLTTRCPSSPVWTSNLSGMLASGGPRRQTAPFRGCVCTNYVCMTR